MRYLYDAKNCNKVLNIKHVSERYWYWGQITVYKIRQWLGAVPTIHGHSSCFVCGVEQSLSFYYILININIFY
jgi:hypothetical protein